MGVRGGYGYTGYCNSGTANVSIEHDIKHRETSLEDHARAGIRYKTESNPLSQLYLNTMADMGEIYRDTGYNIIHGAHRYRHLDICLFLRGTSSPGRNPF